MSDDDERKILTEDRDYNLKLRAAELDRERFQYQREQDQKGNFISRHSSVIVTLLIGTFTIAVSIIQTHNNYLLTNNQLKLASEKQDYDNKNTENLNKSEIERADRNFRLELAKLMLSNQEYFINHDLTKIYYLRDEVIGILPDDLGNQILKKMVNNSPDPDIRRAWRDGLYNNNLPDSANILASNPQGSAGPVTADAVSKISEADVQKIFPDIDHARLSDIFNAAKEFEINTDPAFGIFLGYVLVESNHLKISTGNMNFSATAIRWPNKISAEDANTLAHNPEALANRVYANRMGNIDPGDGWKFRERGYITLVGRENYQLAGNRLHLDLLGNPDLVLEPKLNARVSAYLFRDIAYEAAKRNDIRTVVQRLNGGINGISEIVQSIQKFNGPFRPGGITTSE